MTIVVPLFFWLVGLVLFLLPPGMITMGYFLAGIPVIIFFIVWALILILAYRYLKARNADNRSLAPALGFLTVCPAVWTADIYALSCRLISMEGNFICPKYKQDQIIGVPDVTGVEYYFRRFCVALLIVLLSWLVGYFSHQMMKRHPSYTYGKAVLLHFFAGAALSLLMFALVPFLAPV